jgi:hypothetical protein
MVIYGNAAAGGPVDIIAQDGPITSITGRLTRSSLTRYRTR